MAAGVVSLWKMRWLGGVTITALDDHADLVPVKQSFAHNAVPWMAPR